MNDYWLLVRALTLVIYFTVKVRIGALDGYFVAKRLNPDPHVRYIPYYWSIYTLLFPVTVGLNVTCVFVLATSGDAHRLPWDLHSGISPGRRRGLNEVPCAKSGLVVFKVNVLPTLQLIWFCFSFNFRTNPNFGEHFHWLYLLWHVICMSQNICPMTTCVICNCLLKWYIYTCLSSVLGLCFSYLCGILVH